MPPLKWLRAVYHALFEKLVRELEARGYRPALKWLRAVYDALFPMAPGEGERETAVEAWVSPLLLLPFAATVALGYFRLLTATVGDLAAEELSLRYLP